MSPLPVANDIACRRGLSGWFEALVRRSAAGLFVLLVATMVFGLGTVLYVGLDPDQQVRVNTEPLAMLALAAFVLLLHASWIVGSGRKKIVLYLRRFRRAAANEALSGAMHRTLKPWARLVVLDDAHLQPVSVPLRERLLTLGSALPVLAGLLFALAVGASVSGPVLLEHASGSTYQRGVISITTRSATAKDRTRYSDTPALLAFPGALALWGVLGFCGLLSLRCLRSSAQARRRVSRQQDVVDVVRHMETLGGWMAAPKPLGAMTTVVSVEDAWWQDVVTELAARADAIVLDVSEPTGPIWWEIALCATRHPDKLLLIMDADDNFTRRETPPDPADVERLGQQVVRTRHGGVLLYESGKPQTQTRFQRQLRSFVRSLPARLHAARP